MINPPPYGPLMIDIAGHMLSDLDRDRLANPLVGGVILFSRNFENVEQLQALCTAIHSLRSPALLISVDHEGGRVQRFRTGFTGIPAMRRLGILWQKDRDAALSAARGIGYVLAAELLACGVDFSFTPVLDLDWGRSAVIGNRALHSDPAVVSVLATALIRGLREAGMACCGKHFPGHGWAEADSHIAIPRDERQMPEIEADIDPYRAVDLDAVMPAHVIYPTVDSRPAGFSPVWLTFLRREIGFEGVIFSDDLSMEGATVAGGIVERADAAWSAGCDMLLVCNSPESVGILLEQWRPVSCPERSVRVGRLRPSMVAMSWEGLKGNQAYCDGLNAIARIEASLA